MKTAEILRVNVNISAAVVKTAEILSQKCSEKWKTAEILQVNYSICAAIVKIAETLRPIYLFCCNSENDTLQKYCK